MRWLAESQKYMTEKYNCGKCNKPFKGKLEKGAKCSKCGYNAFTSPTLKKMARAFEKLLNN